MSSLLKHHFSDSLLNQFNFDGTAGKKKMNMRPIVEKLLRPLWETAIGDIVEPFDKALRRGLYLAKERYRKHSNN
jgi:hypothetical protein